METISENVIVKNVTKQCLEAKRKQRKIGLVINFIEGAFLLLAALLPFASIGNYDLENSYLLVFNYLRNFMNKESTSISYLLYFVIFSGFLIFIGVSNIFSFISNLVKKEEVSKEQFYINEKDEKIVISFSFILGKIIFAVILLCIAGVLLSINNAKLNVYGFTSRSNLIIIIYFVMRIISHITYDYQTFKYDEKCANTEEEVILRANKKKVDKNEKIEKDENDSGAKRNKVVTYALFPVFILFICVVVALTGAFTYYHTMYNGYTYMGKDTVAGWVLSPDDSGLLRFDQKLDEHAIKTVKRNGYGCKCISFENGNNSQKFVFYGDSYDFAYAKIDELEKEILTLWPEDLTEEEFEKYTAKIKAMEEAISALKENIYPYEFVKFEKGFMTDLGYNATGRDEVKWGVKQGGIKSLMFHERVTLTDRYCKNEKSMDSFAVGTDFNKELIVARVRYADGSVRISKIKPLNAEELNNASAGVHLLKWADSWGEYQVEITLY